MTGGCPITLADGPTGELRWPEPEKKEGLASLRPTDAPPPSQMLIQQLLQLDRSLRDLFLNPVVDALIDHLIGRAPITGAKNRRFSSTNSFVKWQGEYGYGPNLGLHCDQGANPLPWGSRALTANATWCLTEYTQEDGALAYVPGSHRSNAHPPSGAAKFAKPVVCEHGAVIVWPRRHMARRLPEAHAGPAPQRGRLLPAPSRAAAGEHEGHDAGSALGGLRRFRPDARADRLRRHLPLSSADPAGTNAGERRIARGRENAGATRNWRDVVQAHGSSDAGRFARRTRMSSPHAKT